MNALSSGLLSTWLAVTGLWPIALDQTPAAHVVQAPTASLAQPITQDTSSLGSLTQAKGVQVTDLTTGNVLLDREADQARPMASLTKLMTAYVILSRHKLTESVPVTSAIYSLNGTNSQIIGLKVGDSLTVESTLKALLIYSANDAAVALAAFDSGSEAAFVAAMNQAARDLGMTKTSFANASGLDADGHVSTPADMTTLARVALTSQALRDIVKQPTATIITQQGVVLRLTSTNELLAIDKLVQGVKTGTTDKAGQCLITYDVDAAGHAIVTVMLNSPDRFPETSRVVHYLLDKPAP